MKSFVAGEDVTIGVLLARDGEPFVPDSGSVSWSLRGHTGAVEIPAATITGVVDSTVLVVTPAAANALDSRSLEKRTLMVTCLVNGQPFTLTDHYQIHEFLNHTVTPRQVRTFIGIDDGELADDEISLVDAYFEFAGHVGDTILVTALAGDVKTERAANKGILASAVILLLPSLAQRLSKSAGDGANKVDRFDLDVDALWAKARDQRDKAITDVTQLDPVARTITIGASVVDPFTGA